MQNKYFGIFAILAVVLGLIGFAGCLVLYLVSNEGVNKISVTTNQIIFVSVLLLVVGTASVYYLEKNSRTKVQTITEKQIIICLKKVIDEEIQIKIDESVISRIEAKLGNIQIQQSAFESTLYEKLENIFFTKNSNMKFLQDMAASISNKDNAWTNEQIERFLKCMESIRTMMKKE